MFQIAILINWFIGVVLIGVGVGHLFVWMFSAWSQRYLAPDPRDGELRVPSWATGIIERFIFGSLVFISVDPGTSIAALGGWLALKLATNWSHPSFPNSPDARHYAIRALLAGLISMSFAFIGGLLGRHAQIWLPS